MNLLNHHLRELNKVEIPGTVFGRLVFGQYVYAHFLRHLKGRKILETASEPRHVRFSVLPFG